jgi:hypothetical protein
LDSFVAGAATAANVAGSSLTLDVKVQAVACSEGMPSLLVAARRGAFDHAC